MTNTEGKMRPLVAEDLPRVIEIDENNTGRTRRDFFEKRVSAALKDPKEFVYIAYENGGDLQGYLLVRLQQGAFGGDKIVAVVDDIGVCSEAQRHGIGHQLMSELTSIVKKKGITEIRSQADWSDQSMLNFFGATGFQLAPRAIYERDTSYLDTEVAVNDDDEPLEVDYSDPSSDDSAALSRDQVPCRSMKAQDLAAITKIDGKILGYDRSSYYERKMREILEESGIRVSLVAEFDDHVVGFVMARVDFGEFGKTEPSAIIDTMGVDPGYASKNVGGALLSQLMANLTVLRTDIVRTEVGVEQLALTGFLQNNGFNPAQSLSLTKVV
ncbi:MAG: GNAT family N-acetyltransferase [Emcibacter sp.]|nr:GNAT family N-acetyltransferase [Emcibacter sp.]